MKFDGAEPAWYPSGNCPPRTVAWRLPANSASADEIRRVRDGAPMEGDFMFDHMKRAAAALALVGVAVLVTGPAAQARVPKLVTCPEYNPNDNTDSTVFQGTAQNLVVPAGHACVIAGAKITKNVTLESGSTFGAIGSTIGRDLISNGASVVTTGVYQTPGGKGPEPVLVRHDIVLNGSSYNLDFCDTTVGHNFTANGLQNAYELQIGDSSKNNLDYTDDFYSCQEFSLSPPVTINHDLTITNSKFGLLDVSNDTIGRNLTVTGNTTTYSSEGYLPAGQGTWVANDSIGKIATCSGNSPELASAGPDAQQNTAGKTNNCKF
ncbi:MAG TPA: hypothetical protein VNV44_15210 [Solirubrobacteraceae bacterium]|nr:hypothetical protein [Solirubrobacteraceae bacterium]